MKKLTLLVAFFFIGAGCDSAESHQANMNVGNSNNDSSASFAQKIDCKNALDNYESEVSEKNKSSLSLGRYIPIKFESILDGYYSPSLDTCIAYTDESNTGSEIRNFNQRFLRDILSNNIVYMTDPFYYDEQCPTLDIGKNNKEKYDACEEKKRDFFSKIHLRSLMKR